MTNQYSKGDLVIAKLGTNPWWPGVVINCPKTCKSFKENDNKCQVYVKFFQINTETWIEMSNILNCTSRKDMELYLSKAGGNSSNSKYVNYVPQAMVELYNKSWNSYDKLQFEKKKCSEKVTKDNRKRNYNNFSSSKNNIDCFLYPCEICLKSKIEFKYLNVNKIFLNMNVTDRKSYFDSIMIDNFIDVDKKCSNFCIWKYHSNCIKSENDLVCSCNKSVWFCSICEELINVNQLFVCDKHECMRPYHKSCLSWYFITSPDMSQCPLHHCINCSLDYMVPKEESCETGLISCVKCKVAFHNDIDCLPTKYLQITKDLIICCRHLIDSTQLQSGFCFTCGSEINGVPAACCEFCPVTYHCNEDCLPSSIELACENSFICEGCRFPYIRRRSFVHLTLPQTIDLSKTVHEWKFGIPMQKEPDPAAPLLIQDENGQRWTSSINRTISINLQSINNLLCFGILRSMEMQHAIRHMSQIVCGVSDRFKMRQNYYRNAFVLQFSGLFPVTQNVYQFRDMTHQKEPMEKCSCENSCTTNKCINVALNMECTATTCSAISQCRNRRLQKLQYPRFKLIVCKGKDSFLEMEEPVVKDILVMEFVGEVKRISSINSESVNSDSKLLKLSTDYVLDCNEFCNISRFVQHSDCPNLQPKHLMVTGLPRIGLFSSRRIIRGEILRLDFNELLSFNATKEKLTEFRYNFIAWTEATLPKVISTDEIQVIDLCDESNDSIEGPSIENISYKWPICPVCLLEVSFDMSKSRVLIHCQSCFTVFHFHCACSTLDINRMTFINIHSQSKLKNYICAFCLCK